MKQCIRCLLTGIIIVGLSGQAIAQEIVRLASGDWPPYFSEQLKYDGVISRVITEAFARKGIKVEYNYRPWKRSYMEAKDGRWDGTPGWYKTAEREQSFYFSEPIFTTKIVFFHLKSFSFQWQQIEDLKAFKFGTILGYEYEETFDQLIKNSAIYVEEVAQEIQNFKKLLALRIDAFVCDLDVGMQLLAQSELSETESQQITYHSTPLKIRDAYLLLGKHAPKNSGMIAVFNHGLRELRQESKYELFWTEFFQGKYVQP